MIAGILWEFDFGIRKIQAITSPDAVINNPLAAPSFKF